MKVFVSIGSNLGNRKEMIASAIQKIENLCGDIKKCSSIYETAPWGYTSENKYLNCCIELETKLTPLRLLNSFKLIEHSMGRIFSDHYIDRVIDIDIIFYGNRCVNTQRLIIPHPKLSDRAFVLVPLHEIAHRWIHPTLFLTISQLLSCCNNVKEIKKCKFAI